MDLEIIVDNLPLYLRGLWWTTWLTAASLLLGLALAVPLGLLRTSRNPAINGPVWAYTYFFRGTPLLIQIYLIYYGSGQFVWMRDSALWIMFSQAWFCALLAFTLNTAAYTAEIVRGAVLNTPSGEIEAARACGMSTATLYRRVILPSAFRRGLPAYGNEVIFMLHGSAVASVITIVDLTGAARIVNSRYYSPYDAFITAALFYLALTFVLVGLFRLAEWRWHAHLRPRAQA